MDNKKVHIDHLYRDKQESFTHLPAGAWDDMDKRLGTEPMKPASSHWWWYLLGAVLAGLLVYQLLRTTDTHSDRKTPAPPGSTQNIPATIDDGTSPSDQPKNGRGDQLASASQNELSDEPAINATSEKTISKTRTSKTMNEDQHAARSSSSHTGHAINVNKDNNLNAHKPGITRLTTITDNPKKNDAHDPIPADKYKRINKTNQENLAANQQGSWQQDPGTMQNNKDNIAEKQPPVPATTPGEDPDKDKSTTGIAKTKSAEVSRAHGGEKPSPTENTINNPPDTNTESKKTKNSEPENTASKENEQGSVTDNKSEPTGTSKKIDTGPESAVISKNNEGDSPSSKETTGKASDPQDPKPGRKAKKYGANSVTQKDNGQEQLSPRNTDPSDLDKKTRAATPPIVKAKKAGQQEPEQNEQTPLSPQPAASDIHEKYEGIPVDPQPAGEAPSRSQIPKEKRKKKFEFGMKAGYEAGIQSGAVNKPVGVIYGQYYLSDKLSISIQPTVKKGRATTLSTPAGKSYYSLTGTTVDTTLVGAPGTLFYYLDSFFHGYDSITTSYKSETNVFEIELPLIASYDLSPHIGFSAGINFTKGKLVTITEDIQYHTGLVQVDTFHRPANSTSVDPPDTSKSFFHTAEPFANFTPGNYGNAEPNPLRIGYMLGVNYKRKRWLVELTLNQQISGLSSVTNDKIKKLYSQPYFRLLLGLRL